MREKEDWFWLTSDHNSFRLAPPKPKKSISASFSFLAPPYLEQRGAIKIGGILNLNLQYPSSAQGKAADTNLSHHHHHCFFFSQKDFANHYNPEKKSLCFDIFHFHRSEVCPLSPVLVPNNMFLRPLLPFLLATLPLQMDSR